jgi:hypothetical protein
VHPAYKTMIWHLHSICLNDFKTKLDGLLSNGKGFKSSVKYLTPSIMLKFDEGSTGNIQIHSSSICFKFTLVVMWPFLTYLIIFTFTHYLYILFYTFSI